MSGTSATNPGNGVTSRNRTQQNPEPGYPGLHSREEPPASSLAAKMFSCLPLPRGRGLGRAHRQSVWERGRLWLRTPPRSLWPFAQRNRKVTGETQAGPPLPSHPGNTESFPCESGWVFSGYVCLKQAQADVGPKPVGRMTPHLRGEQAGPDGESRGSASCPG